MLAGLILVERMTCSLGKDKPIWIMSIKQNDHFSFENIKTF